MKRKRSKKGKSKSASASKDEAAVVSVASESREDSSGAGEENQSKNSTNEDKDAECESGMEVDTPSSTGTDQPLKAASAKPSSSVDKESSGKLSVRHVKVKLKSSKALESPTDTDRSSPPLGSQKQGAASDKREDSGSSVPDSKMSGSGNVAKKPGSIKIKTSKVVDGDIMASKDSVLKAHKPPAQVSQYDKEELGSALIVIRKIMKMDAALPFNAPVNPEALGIPDYFDIIDTPMDFGTICSNIEKGGKYMNSEDVYKDVQYIWGNCYKYNNKGDYILDLMRRVKKNFMKYWSAAGLYTGQSGGTSGADGAQETNAANQGSAKSSQPKQKSKKRHGRRHKSDCLCAVCVLQRRRKEREENARLANGQSADEGVTPETKQEGASSPVESHGGEDSSSNMDDNSQDLGTDAEVEGKAEETKLEESEKQTNSPDGKSNDEMDVDEGEEEEEEIHDRPEGSNEALQNSQLAEKSGDEDMSGQLDPQVPENPDGAVDVAENDHEVAVQHEGSMAVKQNTHKQLVDSQKAGMFDKFRQEDPILLDLCTKLFPEKRRSMWNGPHSLFAQQDPTPARVSSLHRAIETLMR
ncbi:unnamed protein product [Linum trigynum]|uniref:Bromo domain-containing protein n=1 Tax=Linum trigynum TaxID=586398 RepID=A0AAV2EHZ1_9ROSI